MLSDYCKQIKDKFGIATGQVHKLILTLFDKQKNFLHYKNLQLYLSVGLKLTKFHRALKFKQSTWSKPYIEKRKTAKDSFGKDFFRLMNNAVFGITMENLSKVRGLTSNGL